MKRFLLGMALLCAPSISYSTDLIVFSYNRPLQLYAFLESLKNCATGLTSISILYRADDAQYENGYQEVQRDFSDAFNVVWRRQGSDPASDFKAITLELMNRGGSEYVVFGVDDIIFTRPFDLQQCVNSMKSTNAYGFFLRLGKNVDSCEIGNCTFGCPHLGFEDNSIYSWKFSDGQHVWGYAHSVDMTVYKKADIRDDFSGMGYQGPNSLESEWCGRTAKILNRKGLCFEHSVMVNIPTNKVQTFCDAWSSGEYSPKELLDLFFEGKKIDIASLYFIKNRSAHIKYEITFAER